MSLDLSKAKPYDTIVLRHHHLVLVPEYDCGYYRDRDRKLIAAEKTLYEIKNEALENKWDEWTQGRKDAATEVLRVVTKPRGNKDDI